MIGTLDAGISAGSVRQTGPASAASDWISAAEPMMGGLVAVRLAVPGETGPEGPRDRGRRHRAAELDARRAIARLRAWAGRLTRFDEASELSRLNRDARTAVRVGPTLAAVLDWARAAEIVTDGLVDATLLDARLAAEHGTDARLPLHRAWSLERGRRSTVVRRPPGVRFDLDGVAKGWLADRALDLLGGHAPAVVDADGDVAIRTAAGSPCAIGVADPRTDDGRLATIDLPGDRAGVYGVATSGTSVHRWPARGPSAHHLIDPATARPAVTDVAQATVVTDTARRAEALAKAVVVAGLDRGLRLLDRRDVAGAVLLTEGGDVLATGRLAGWLR